MHGVADVVLIPGQDWPGGYARLGMVLLGGEDPAGNTHAGVCCLLAHPEVSLFFLVTFGDLQGPPVAGSRPPRAAPAR
jgi:hypothetical protein